MAEKIGGGFLNGFSYIADNKRIACEKIKDRT